jgi:sugar lactone lactonase YvrE
MNTKRSPSLLAAVLATGLVASCASKGESKPPAVAIAGPATLVTTFDPAKGGLPEGLVLDHGTAYVGFAPISEVVKVDLAAGKVESFGTLPKPVPNKGFMTGLQAAGDGAILAALVSFAPEVQPGIYRIPAGGGAATLYAKHAEMVFPNGFVDDGAGGQYITDSAAGALFHLSASGELSKWVADPSLKGNTDFCGKGVGAGFDIGANGIARIGSTLYVANNDLAQLVSIPVNADGTPGAAKLLAGPDCENLGGADGLVAAPDGTLILAGNRINKLVAVTLDGKLRVIAAGPPLDFPASVAFDGASLVATNFALANASAGKAAQPGIIRIGEH